MKNQYSYYFNELLTKCIYVTPDKCPCIRISETIKLLQEYAEDCADTVERTDLLDSLESMIGWSEGYKEHIIDKEFNDMLLTPLTIDIDNAKSSLDEYKKLYGIEKVE